MKEFKGKVALITGAANGIGLAFAKEAAKRGMNLALVDIDSENLPPAKAAAEDYGVSCLAIVADVSLYDEVKDSVKKTMDTYGQIDLLFMNAGIATAGSLTNIPIRDWEWSFAVNTLSHAYYLYEVFPIMKAQGSSAHIMSTASIAGIRAGMTVNPPYFSSKHGAVSIIESVKAEVMSNKLDIGVSCFCPMYIATDIHNCERHRPVRFRNEDDPFYTSEEYLAARAIFEKNIKNGMPIDTVGQRLFKAIEENQMYIITHTATIPYIEERHRTIENDAKKELN